MSFKKGDIIQTKEKSHYYKMEILAVDFDSYHGRSYKFRAFGTKVEGDWIKASEIEPYFVLDINQHFNNDLEGTLNEKE